MANCDTFNAIGGILVMLTELVAMTALLVIIVTVLRSKDK